MFLRKSFQEFLVLHSEAEPLPTAPLPPEPEPPSQDREPPRRLIDWRWLEAREDTP